MTKYAILVFLILMCRNGKCSEVVDIGNQLIRNIKSGNPQPEILIIDSIIIKGQERTRLKVITRELTFLEGDTLVEEQLPTLLSVNRKRLINTNLFSVVGF